MSGKGSKPRPMQISQTKFDSNWDKIFGGDKMHEHKDGHEILVQEIVSQFYSDNGKREAHVVKSVKGFSVEFYERSRLERTVDMHSKSLQYAEDAAENWCLGLMP